MNDVLRKKINLLVHLTKVDGQFHTSEKKYLHELFAEHGINNLDIQSTNGRADVFNETSSILEKEELLFWALQLVKADGLIHPDEISFCKKLSEKLKFLPGIVDEYAHEDLPPLNDFVAQTVKFKIN